MAIDQRESKTAYWWLGAIDIAKAVWLGIHDLKIIDACGTWVPE